MENNKATNIINEDRQGRDRRFMRLYMSMERRICGFVISAVPNWSDVDDLVQEIAGVMWSKFDDFEPGTDFAAWSLTITRYQIMAYRQKTRATVRQFSDRTIEAIQESAVSDMQTDDVRRDALRECVKKLKDRDRKILQLRYETGGSIRRLAERIDLSVNTLYKLLNRVHNQLYHCIMRNIPTEERLL